MKVIALGDRETILLFSLAGIEGKIMKNEIDAIEEITRIKKSRKYGLLIVSEKIALWAYDIISQIRFSRSCLLIVEIPDKEGHMESGKTLYDYIRESVGIKV